MKIPRWGKGAATARTRDNANRLPAATVSPAPTPPKAPRRADMPEPSGTATAAAHPVAKSATPAPEPGLSALAVADLARSGIAPADAAKLGMFSVENAQAELNHGEMRAEPGLVIPYYQPNGRDLVEFERDGATFPFGRVRYLGEVAPKRGFTVAKKPGKYGQPARTDVYAYFPRVVAWSDVAADRYQPICLVEGEKKAAKLALEGFNAIGIGGCWNFRNQGGLEGVRTLIPELEQFAWQGRDVYLALDGDAATNASIAAAEGTLALELGLRRGASVYQIRFPMAPDGKRMGADDFIVANDAAAFEKLAQAAPKMREADALVEDLNREYAIICISGKTFVMRAEHDSTLNRRRLSFFSRRDFKDALANRLVASPNDPSKQAPLSEVWFTHSNRREYLAGMTLAPMREVPNGVFNLWRGFSVEPVAGDWSLLRAHILENVCSGDQEHFDYLLSWMARLVQHPGEAGQVAVVLRGGRGVGKGIVATSLGRLINDHFIHALQADHVTGKFNGHLQDCVLLFGDESFFAGNPAHEKILNGLITETTRLSEQKFQSAITIPNYIHLILSTNSDWAIPAAIDERRYFVLDVPDHPHKQDSAYFGAIAAQMNAGGLAAMFHDLQERDLSGFDVRRVPQTTALADQKRHTLHTRGGALAWLQDVLTAGEIRHMGDPPTTLTWSERELLVSRTDLFDAYETWERKRPGRPHPDSREVFGKRLSAALGNTFRGGDNVKMPKSLSSSRQRAYWLAPLHQCREAFRQSQKMPTLWSEGDE